MANISYFIFVLPVLLFLLALYFFSGRGTMLISGYNTLSKEERQNYNTQELTRAMGIFTLVLATLVTFSLYMGMIARNMMWALVGLICVFVFTIFWIVYMNKSRKIKTNR